jgi:hypothetical protein
MIARTLAMALGALSLTAGVAAAQMQPIPNPPEKPAMHPAKHKMMMHHRKHHHHMAKPAPAKTADDKSGEKPK